MTLFWGRDDDGDAPSRAWYNTNSRGQTHPVESMPANAFGLHDIVGDVWRWTEDCHADNYASAPTDVSAAESGSTCLHAVMGFRVARRLP